MMNRNLWKVTYESFFDCGSHPSKRETKSVTIATNSDGLQGVRDDIEASFSCQQSGCRILSGEYIGQVMVPHG